MQFLIYADQMLFYNFYYFNIFIIEIKWYITTIPELKFAYIIFNIIYMFFLYLLFSCSSEMGVTKAPFANSVMGNFDLAKV